MPKCSLRNNSRRCGYNSGRWELSPVYIQRKSARVRTEGQFQNCDWLNLLKVSKVRTRFVPRCSNVILVTLNRFLPSQFPYNCISAFFLSVISQRNSSIFYFCQHKNVFNKMPLLQKMQLYGNRPLKGNEHL